MLNFFFLIGPFPVNIKNIHRYPLLLILKSQTCIPCRLPRFDNHHQNWLHLFRACRSSSRRSPSVESAEYKKTRVPIGNLAFNRIIQQNARFKNGSTKSTKAFPLRLISSIKLKNALKRKIDLTFRLVLRLTDTLPIYMGDIFLAKRVPGALTHAHRHVLRHRRSNAVVSAVAGYKCFHLHYLQKEILGCSDSPCCLRPTELAHGTFGALVSAGTSELVAHGLNARVLASDDLELALHHSLLPVLSLCLHSDTYGRYGKDSVAPISVCACVLISIAHRTSQAKIFIVIIISNVEKKFNSYPCEFTKLTENMG